MIPGFFQTIQKDAVLLAQPKNAKADKETEFKVSVAGIRAIGALAMAFGTIITVAAMPYLFSSTVAFTIIAAVGVAAYAVGHDVFVLGNNIEKDKKGLGIMNELRAGLASMKSRDQEIETRLTPFTNGMFFQTLVHTIIISETKKALAK